MEEPKISRSEELEHVEDGELCTSHKEFLLARYGTLDLVPLPSESTDDPLNWPWWRKNVNLVLVSFHAMMCLFMGAGIIPAYEDMAEEMGVSLQSATYFTSMQIAMLGIAPLVWKPLSMRIGLRPIWLISTFCSAICNIGCALSKSYGAMSISRLLGAFFISPALALGPEVVTQIFFKSERGRKMGIWAYVLFPNQLMEVDECVLTADRRLMVTLGPSLGPFLMSFVAFHVGWRWIFWIFVIVNLFECALYFLLSPETFFPAKGSPSHTKSSVQAKYLRFPLLSKAPLKLIDFFSPLKVARHHVIWITTAAYSIIFNFAFVLLTVEIPQIFGEKFHLNTQQIGLQFLGIIVGGIIGEQAAGPLSDFMMISFVKRHHGQIVQPEFRLWLSYLGYSTVIAGFLVWGFRTADLPFGHYDVSPIVGIGISSFGAQIITTSAFTYMVDCYPAESADIGVFANLTRQIWGFIGPFWFPIMFQSAGIKGSAGIMVGVLTIASLVPILCVQAFGAKVRRSELAHVESPV